jgi:SAM-dependent methyltransferase
MLHKIVGKILPSVIRQTLERWLKGGQETIIASNGYEVIGDEVAAELMKGWLHPAVAQRQHHAFAPLLRQMHEGKTREDFLAVARAVQATGLQDPLIIEVGCGSGWNSEVLTYLLKQPIYYIGLDYSQAMTRLGRAHYPDVHFIVGDAAELPLQSKCCDILLSGTVLMHLLGYPAAIAESRRVARHWCIFHTVPVLSSRQTTVLRKKAYGEDTIEIVFNEEEFCHLVDRQGLTIHQVLESMPYNLEFLLGEPTVTKSYVCEVRH